MSTIAELRELVGPVLLDNHAMLELAASLGFHLAPSRGDPAIEARLKL